MRRSADFTAAVRGGRRVARSTLVLHVRSRPACTESTRVGLIISKSVGNSVVRHRVARRLRAVCAERIASWRPGDLVVVRALPRAASATFAQLESDLTSAAERVQSVMDGQEARP